MSSFKYLAAVIGSPILQSRSPQLHSAAYLALGIEKEWTYSKVEVDESTLVDFIKEVKDSWENCDSSKGETPLWRGFSVTMPLKSAVIEHLDFIDSDAKEAEAVNTVVVNFDTDHNRPFLSGYNTDIFGIVAAVKEAVQKEFKTGGECLILGNGATSRSAKIAAKQLGLIPKIAARKGEFEVDITNIDELFVAAQKSELIISTLSWSGAKEVIPKLAARFSEKSQGDTSNKLSTSKLPMLECAFPSVLPSSIKGERMLLWQAVKQVELMTGKKITPEEMDVL